MLQKTIKKLIGLKKEELDLFLEQKQMIAQPARLIPMLKTGDEMALTSIFLTTIKLVKEFRDDLFKQINLNRSGRVLYFTEVSFPEISKSRFDGMLIIISKGVISDAVILEMKNKTNKIDLAQIEDYIGIAKTLKINKLVTISNEFVPNPSQSPVKIKVPKNFSLLHFSWTYLVTKGQLLLFDNDTNIADEDQVEIMREALYYFENPASGVSGYVQMKPGWKEICESIRAQKPLKNSDQAVEDALLSWYEEEKDMALLLSRKLGVLVKSSAKNKDSLKQDSTRLIKENYIIGMLSIKNSVSDIKINIEFERRIVTMSVKVTPPLDKGTTARITWISKQLELCKKKSEGKFNTLHKDLWIEGNVKFAKANIKVKLDRLSELNELAKGKEIQAFYIVLSRDFGAGFASTKKFIVLIEQMISDYYEGSVQHLSNWKAPAPRIVN